MFILERKAQIPNLKFRKVNSKTYAPAEQVLTHESMEYRVKNKKDAFPIR